MLFRARQFEFVFPRPAVVMGIVNVTPDSFSDGGRFLAADAAVEHALKLEAEGAGILDIGGESTRPGAVAVDEAEELRRVIPVIERLVGRVKVPISVDTMKPGVARVALAAGASIVNDVAAAQREPGDTLWRTVAESGAGYVCMHMQGTPRMMQEKPEYVDVVGEVSEFFRERLGRLNDCGVQNERVIFDVGIGFGKTLEHNLQLLGALAGFQELGRPLLLGVSRKSFMATLSGVETSARLPASLACAVLAIASGTQIIRAHDVADTVQAIRMAEAVRARR